MNAPAAPLDKPHASPGLRALLDRAEAVCRDLRFSSVRAWKERTGGLAIGYMPVYAPRELIHAQGGLPVGVMGAGDDLEIIRGDAYYQSYICHIPRSTIEMGLNGGLDPLDGMLFPAICDVIRNLSGMWKVLFPGKLVRYLDVPQDFDPARGGVFWREELEALSRELTERGAKPLEAEALRRSIAVFDENRRLVRGLYDLRAREPWKVPTSELYLLLRAGVVLPVEESTEMFKTYRAAVERDASRRPLDQARVVLAGSFCEQPPLGLIRTLERSGCYIVDDDFVQVHRWVKGDVAIDGARGAMGDPLDALVRSLLFDAIDHPTRHREDPCPTGPCARPGEPRAGTGKGLDLVARVRKSGAGGVVFCAPSFCDPALLDQPMGVAAVEKAGIPWTAFKYSENGGQFQVIREQAGTFADSIKLWADDLKTEEVHA